MGGKPIMALAILGMPLGKIPPRRCARSWRAAPRSAPRPASRSPAAIRSTAPEPIYGLAVIGTCRPEHVRRNADARAGDALILTKPLGVGIYSAAIKKGALSPAGYAEMIATTTLLNRVGAELAQDAGRPRHHRRHRLRPARPRLEMARGSEARAVDLRAGDVPLLPQAAALAQEGFVTGASQRNWASYGDGRHAAGRLPDWRRHLLTDPQTSGGLLVACAPERAADDRADRSGRPATPPPASSAAPSPATLPSSCRTEPAVT